MPEIFDTEPKIEGIIEDTDTTPGGVGQDVLDVAIDVNETPDITGLNPGDSNTVTIEFEEIAFSSIPEHQSVTEFEKYSLGSGQDVVEENNSDDMLNVLTRTYVLNDHNWISGHRTQDTVFI